MIKIIIVKEEEQMENIFYDRSTGRVINDEVAKALTTKDRSILGNVKVGLMSRDYAIIENGHVKNMPNMQKEIIIDPFAYVAQQEAKKSETPNYVLDILDVAKKPTAEEEYQRSIEDSLAFFNARSSANNQVPPQRETEPIVKIPRKSQYTSEQKRQIYQNARNKSKPAQKQTVERQRGRLKFFNRQFIAYALVAVMSITALLLTQQASKRITNISNTSAVQSAMSDLLVDPNAKHSPSIITRNTYPTDDFQNFWFDNAGIAEELLELPDEAFDAELYATYTEMGVNRKNAYIDNFSKIIYYLGLYADAEKDSLAFARTNGCCDFDEYMIKNGFVDENGEPSVDKFIEHSLQAVKMYRPYLEDMVEDRNNAALDENGLGRGGK